MGKCTSCGSFGTFKEATIKNKVPKSVSNSIVRPKKLEEIEKLSNERIKTSIGELDRVLSGGFVTGSLTLVGGDPGIGKSTLLLQICQNIGNQDKSILYVSGEESLQQIKLRANRLGIDTENLSILSETNMSIAESIILEDKPDFVIIDSIQTVYKDEITSSARKEARNKSTEGRRESVGG